MEQTVRLRYVTRRHHPLPSGTFDVNSDEIQFSLTVKDPAWDARLQREKWNAENRTFKMVSCSEANWPL